MELKSAFASSTSRQNNVFCVFVWNSDTLLSFIDLSQSYLSSCSVCDLQSIYQVHVILYFFCLLCSIDFIRFSWSRKNDQIKMLQLITKTIMWSLCVTFSALSVVQLLIVYVKKFSTQPWKPKERPNAPACLTDPKYGVHKFAELNVSA